MGTLLHALPACLAGWQVVDARGGGKASANLMSMEELRDLFSFDADTLSNTYDSMCREAGPAGAGEDGQLARGEQVQQQQRRRRQGGRGGGSGTVPDSEEEEEIGEGWEEQQQHETGMHDDAPGGDGPAGPLPTSAAVAAAGGTIHKPQEGKPAEEDLKGWGHHSSMETVPDQLMQQIGGEHVSFVFSLEVDGRDVEPEAPLPPIQQRAMGAAAAAAGPAGLGPRPRQPAAALHPPPQQQQVQQQQRVQQQQVQKPPGAAALLRPPGGKENGGGSSGRGEAGPGPGSSAAAASGSANHSAAGQCRGAATQPVAAPAGAAAAGAMKAEGASAAAPSRPAVTASAPGVAAPAARPGLSLSRPPASVQVVGTKRRKPSEGFALAMRSTLASLSDSDDDFQ